MGRLREEVEGRINGRSILMFAVVAWISIQVFDAAPEQFIATAIGSAIAGGAGLVADAFDLQEGVRYAGLGLASLFGAAALFVGEGSTLIPVALGLVGAWLALDGVQSLRYEGIDEQDDPQPDGEAVYRRYLRRRIRERLGDRPRSRTELHEAMDADPEDVDAALTRLRERDLVSLRGGVYHRDTPESPGRLARGQSWIIESLRRLVRPVTAELRDDDPYGETEKTKTDIVDSNGVGSKTVSSEKAGSAADRERVRQRERE